MDISLDGTFTYDILEKQQQQPPPPFSKILRKFGTHQKVHFSTVLRSAKIGFPPLRG